MDEWKPIVVNQSKGRPGAGITHTTTRVREGKSEGNPDIERSL